MKFIDKTLNQVEGNRLVDTFLNNRWNSSMNKYSSIDYESQKFKTLLRTPLKQLLLLEQNNFCCYCMRLIEENTKDENRTTLEHIVLRAELTLAGLNRYTHYPIIAHNVCLQSDFENASVKKNTPPYPHQIAYENLTASCSGEFPSKTTYRTCNHKRNETFVEPLFYVSTIEDDITYLKGGFMLSSNSLHDKSIDILNLNYDLLKRIRQVWYHLSVENIDDIENANTEFERNSILTLNLMSLPQAQRNKLIGDFKKETFWKVLLRYKWFYSYYNKP